MPRKGAATAAPKPTENLGSEETAAEVSYNDSVTDEPEPPRRSGRKTPAERAAERAENNGESADVSDPDSPAAFEDWTRPSYADNPGEFEFGSLADADEFLSILWWGAEGTGKTTNLARVMATKLAPKVKGNLLLINAEGGAKATPLGKQGIDTKRVMVFPKPGQKLDFESLERLFYKLQADLEADPESWGAVGWDSITAIFEKLLDNVIEDDMRRTAEILQRSKKGRAGRSGNITLRDRFETEGDDYAKMTNQVRLLLRKYRTLPCHFLVTALERRDVDKKRKGEKVHYGPAVNPALATALLGYVDVVIRTHVLDDATYYGRTTPTEDSRGKDRMFSLPVELVDPTFDRIWAYVHGELDPNRDPAQKRMPGGAEGVLTRRSLADEDGIGHYGPTDEARYHTQDGTPDGPPLAGEQDDPEPPKRGGRRTARSSTPAAASKEPEPSAEEEPGSDQVQPPDPSSEEETKPAPRRSGRKPAADRAAKAAKAEVQADTEGTKSGPARRAAAERASKAEQASGFSDEPPF